MKTQEQILSDLIADFASSQDKVTYFGRDSVARGFLHAISYAVSEIWQDIYQAKRQSHVLTASGSDLDLLAGKFGLVRKGLTGSSTVLNFSGIDETVIPAGTIVTDSTGSIRYQTKYTIKLGKNDSITRPLASSSIGDSVLAESMEEGRKSSIENGLLNKLESTIIGVTSVTNILPSIGGSEIESDEDFRARILEQFSVLNLNTQKFYETLAKYSNPTVYKALAKHNPLNLGTKIYLVKNSFGTYTSPELTAIANNIYSNQRALNPITCTNATIKAIEISFHYKRDQRVSRGKIYSDSSKVISNFIEGIFDFGCTLNYFDLYRRILAVDGITEMRESLFFINQGQQNIALLDTEVPRFIKLTINDGTVTELGIEQEYSSL
ncbi:MAG: baseplate J/gp47 family protein [Bacteroidetes bacterium]|nr:baseplate J/gp47 family protein [Bacteroidota bacterium]